MRTRCKNESETSYDEPVVFSSDHLNAFINSAVDSGLCAIPALLAQQPANWSYNTLLIPRVVAEEIRAYKSRM